MVLGRDNGDVAIRNRHMEKAEEPCVLPEVEPGVGRGGPCNAAPLQRGAFPPEGGNLGLVGCASAGGGGTLAAETFHLVEISRVGLIGHRIRRPRTELRAVL